MIGQDRIKEHIKHRDPFLFVDKLLEWGAEGCVGERTYQDEFFFQGHFPEYPVVPGVLLIEAMAQTGGAGVKEAGLIHGNPIYFLASISKAKFRNQVRPGDTFRMEITHERVSDMIIRQSGKGYVGENLAVEATWMCIRGEE